MPDIAESGTIQSPPDPEGMRAGAKEEQLLESDLGEEEE